MVLFIVGNAVSVIAPSYAVLMGARMLTALTHGTFFGVGALLAVAALMLGSPAISPSAERKL